VGCVTQIGDQNSNVARAAWLSADLPVEVPSTTVNRACGSSQQAVHFAAAMVEAGICDLVVAGGVESMTRVPMGAGRVEGLGKRYPDEMLAIHPIPNMGVSAEMIAEKWGLSRRYLDELSLRSHQRAADARASGRFDKEIVPIRLPDGSMFEQDECIRPDTTLEKLGSLKPVFREDGVVTAGGSSALSDGAAAVLIASREKARALGLKPRASIAAQLVVGVDPVIQLTGPIPATRQVLERTGLALSDIDLFEVNEAFASVLGAWLAEIKPDEAKVNVNGGAIALGHPLGCTGARLVTTILHELERRDARFGLVSMCCGGGFGTATVIEREA
jgi:acetyl-CoA acetyltransferase family protein